MAIFAGIHGSLDDIPPAQVPRFQDELREVLRADGSIYDEIGEQKELSDKLEERMHEELRKFKDTFAVKEDAGLVGAAG